MSSQYGEGARILEYFGDTKGVFLDIGAYDGVTYSNTRPLFESGWGGVLVEPNPFAFVDLARNYASASVHTNQMDRDRDVQPSGDSVVLINAMVRNRYMTSRQVREFWANLPHEVPHAMSTDSEAHRRKFYSHPFQPIYVGSAMLLELSARWGPFHFINIDVGANAEVCREVCLDLDVKPSMVCVELDPDEELKHVPMRMALHQIGLVKQEIIGGNLLAWKPK